MFVQIFVRLKRQIRTILPYDSIATIKVGGVHVHRTTLATGTPSSSSRQFTQHSNWGNSHQVGPSMHTISRNYIILWPHGCLHAWLIQFRTEIWRGKRKGNNRRSYKYIVCMCIYGKTCEICYKTFHLYAILKWKKAFRFFHFYTLRFLHSNFSLWLLPTAHASCPEYKWQNPRTIFSLYKFPADVSKRRIVCICL